MAMFRSIYDEDHPRGCGEHRHESEDEEHYAGSSPRMRGAHVAPLVGGLANGIIPADAGSTAIRLAVT